MYRYFSYSKILRNSRPPFYYKKKSKNIFSNKKRKYKKKNTGQTHSPQREKHLFADKIPEKLCDSHISPLREF